MGRYGEMLLAAEVMTRVQTHTQHKDRGGGLQPPSGLRLTPTRTAPPPGSAACGRGGADPSLPISPHLSPSLAGCGGGGAAGAARRGVGGSVAPLVDAHEALLDPHGRRLRRSGELEPPLCPLAPGRDTSASATRPRHVHDTSATRPAGEHRADLRLWAACIRGARTEMGEAWGRCGGDMGEMWGRHGGDVGEMWGRYGGDVPCSRATPRSRRYRRDMGGGYSGDMAEIWG